MEGATNFEMPDLVRLWILRMLVPLGAQKHFLRPYGCASDRLALVLGVDGSAAPNEKFDRAVAVQLLSKRFEEAEASLASATAPKILRENISRLATLVGLSATDCRILELAVLLRTESLLDDVADWLGELHASKVISILARLLNIPSSELNTALGTHGALTKAGLLSLTRQGTSFLRRKLLLLSGSSLTASGVTALTFSTSFAVLLSLVNPRV